MSFIATDVMHCPLKTRNYAFLLGTCEHQLLIFPSCYLWPDGVCNPVRNVWRMKIWQ